MTTSTHPDKSFLRLVAGLLELVVLSLCLHWLQILRSPRSLVRVCVYKPSYHEHKSVVFGVQSRA